MAKTPLFTVFRAFHLFLKLQKHCEYQQFLQSTRQKCCNLQCFFCLAFKNTGICGVLCISGPKSIGIYSIFCFFSLLPQKTSKRKNTVIYSILWLSKSEKSSEKGVKTALFSDFRYPQNGGGKLFMSDPDSVQKALPSEAEGFLVFFGARHRRVGGLGRAPP